MFKDLKYLLAYTTPFVAWWGFQAGGIFSFGSAYWAFIAIPLIELVVPASDANLGDKEYESRSRQVFFDFLLYLNVPIVYFLLVTYYGQIQSGLTALESIGMTINMGVVLGSLGINVAHELGHRDKKFEQVMAWLLLLPSHYLHFFIEHNRGHHKHVATPEDPSSARLNESLYAFVYRSMTQTYAKAWQLENQRVGTDHGRNMMVYFTILTVVFWLFVGSYFGITVLMYTLVAGFLGAALLEMVNYIEHYGLRRKKISALRYEPVQQWHSWNSNHELGRIVLYELVRHSDHHMKSQRKYQTLRCIDGSPQLPYGYPGSILISLLPPVWFRLMNPRIPETSMKLA